MTIKAVTERTPSLMFDLQQGYPYFEEVNPGIIRQFLPVSGDLEKRPRVLDCGCGRGALAQAIANKGYEVWGIESNSTACQTASTRLHHLIEKDLTQIEKTEPQLANVKFDFIIFSDVLEHVYDPLAVLKSYSHFLNPNGKILISLPNIANWENRIKLFFGYFSYQDTGVMDRTHIRFFTFRTAQLLVHEAGFQVKKVDCDPYLVRAFLPLIKALLLHGKQKSDSDQQVGLTINSPLYRTYLSWIYPIEYQLTRLWKSLFSFRIILDVKKI